MKKAQQEINEMNALRKIARDCMNECPDLSIIKTQKERDAITGPLIRKYSKRAQLEGFTHTRFIYALGVMTGQFIER